MVFRSKTVCNNNSASQNHRSLFATPPTETDFRLDFLGNRGKRMNKPIQLFLCIVALVGVGFSGSAAAATVYVPTDGNVNTIDLKFTSPGSFAIFDADNTALDTSLGYLELDSDGFDTVTFEQVGTDWLLTGSADTFTLSGSAEFIIAYNDTSSWLSDTGVNVLSEDISTLLFLGGSIKLRVIDAEVAPMAPVPVPGAVFMMGSGLIGLAGVARRRAPHIV